MHRRPIIALGNDCASAPINAGQQFSKDVDCLFTWLDFLGQDRCHDFEILVRFILANINDRFGSMLHKVGEELF